MIPGFDYKELYIGTGDVTDYDFQFNIYDPSHLHFYIQDNLGNIVADTDGTDTDWVASVAINSDGGGTLSLAAVLPNAYVLTMLLANDEPSQPTAFPNKNSFTFDVLDGALDFLASCVQRVAYLAQRSLRLHDLDDVEAFDMRLPMNLSTFPGGILTINSDGTGFIVGDTIAVLTANILAETEAYVQEVLAAAVAESIQNLYPGTLIHTGPFTVNEGANADLLGELTDHTLWSQVDYVVRIQRGTNVYARQEFSLFYRNGAWEIALGSDRYGDSAQDHGVTFTANSTTAQINAAVASDGNGNATIDIYKIGWAT